MNQCLLQMAYVTHVKRQNKGRHPSRVRPNPLFLSHIINGFSLPSYPAYSLVIA